jgi:hypothetical protein
MPGRIALERYQLANGLTVILAPDRSAQVVAVDVWYDVGSRDERAGRTGFAHLFEHMMFQGSANVKKGEHMNLIERAGGSMNGSTCRRPHRTTTRRSRPIASRSACGSRPTACARSRSRRRTSRTSARR